MLNRAQLKREAREINRRAQVSPLGFALLFFAITLPLQALDAYVSGDAVTYLEQVAPWLTIPSFLIHDPFPGMLTLFVSIMVALLSLILYAGFRAYTLGTCAGRRMGYGTLFDGFSYSGKLIWLYLNVWARIVLWSMLLIIPGIVAFYRYRFALYNFCENPEMEVREALEMSRIQTVGYKLDLFVMDLSFIGWYLLNSLTANILMIWLQPYIMQTANGFFQTIKEECGVGYFPPADEEFRPYEPYKEQ